MVLEWLEGEQMIDFFFIFRWTKQMSSKEQLS